ncbi:MAG: 23S rRNA (uracil(1939)-C(5))-methyltransferase RlmD, partial [Tissierellia bacterium]|nr:23S rRNA (uracil(1939)-C(5))-methyltransferase RlmD [Tissierellia bacterium]
MDRIDLEIIDLTTEGKGLAKKDQLTYFVDGAKLGQKVLAQPTDYKKNYCLAKTLEILDESPYIQEALCPYANICDGCNFQDIVYERQLEFKKSTIINSINRIAREQLEDIDFEKGPQRYNYRNKIELKVSPFGHLSYFSRKTNDHLAIKECLIANPKINAIISLLQDLIYQYEIRGYEGRKNHGLLKSVTIRSTNIGQSMLVLVFNEEKNLQEFYKDLEASKLVDSLYTCVNSKKNNYKITRPRHVFGLEKILESMGDKSFLISAKSFFQVNTDQAYKIYSDVKTIIQEIRPSLLIDLYSGISTTSIILSDAVDKIISVELLADAVKDAKENASLNKVSNIDFMQGDAGQIINKLDLSKEDSMLLVDPPRKGLDPNIISQIGNSSINQLAYISCNPSTLARDIKEFKNYGFKL